MIHVSPDDAQNLKWVLNKCPKLKGRTTIKEESDFHRKSLIVDPQSPDDCYFCEGSFNWFSAATTIDNEASNQETSIVLSGPIVGPYLQDDDIDY